MTTKKRHEIFRLSVKPVMILLLLYLFTFGVYAACSNNIIYSDPSDGQVRSNGATYNVAWVGDGRANRTSRLFYKFPIPNSIKSGEVSRATLNLYLYKSKKNEVEDVTSPLANIGLGDCMVRHIDDYGDRGGEDFDSPSIGNDPGVLIESTATPDIGYISIDVTRAMQDDIDNGRSFVTFMVLMTVDTDNDNLEDHWNFRLSEYKGKEPFIRYEISPVGGELLKPILIKEALKVLAYGIVFTSALVIFGSSFIRRKQTNF